MKTSEQRKNKLQEMEANEETWKDQTENEEDEKTKRMKKQEHMNKNK